MSEKQEIIKKLVEMQEKFMEYERKEGVDPKDYFTPEGGHPLDGYRQEYRDLSMKLVDLAHEEVGSSPN